MNAVQKFAFSSLAGLALACPISLVSQAANAAPAHVEMNLLCEEQNEHGDDEAYVVLNDSTGQSNVVWAGDVADDDDKKRQTPTIDLGTFDLQPNQSVKLMVSLFERDGQDYRPGLQVGASIARSLVSAAVGVPLPDISALIDELGPNTDDNIGTFSITINSDANGNLTTEVLPTNRAHMRNNGQLVLAGDGARYIPAVYVNNDKAI